MTTRRRAELLDALADGATAADPGRIARGHFLAILEKSPIGERYPTGCASWLLFSTAADGYFLFVVQRRESLTWHDTATAAAAILRIVSTGASLLFSTCAPRLSDDTICFAELITALAMLDAPEAPAKASDDVAQTDLVSKPRSVTVTCSRGRRRPSSPRDDMAHKDLVS